MKKIKVIGFAFFAAFAFCALSASSAFAAAGMEWLLDGAALTEPTALGLITVEGELLLSDMKAPLVGVTDIDCSGFGEGTISPPNAAGNGTDLIEEVIGLAGEGAVIKCTPLEGCETTSTATAQATNLPWETELVLVGEKVRDLVKGKPGYDAECLVFGVKVLDECTGETSYGLENMATESDVLALADAMTNEPEATCTQSKEASGLLEGELLIYDLVENLLLEIS